MLGHGFDEARVGRIVIELPAQGLDALGQRLVGDRDAAPDLAEEAVLGDQPPGLADKEGEGVEITGVELDRCVVTAELAIGRIEGKTIETEAAWRHFSGFPQPLLMTLTAIGGRLDSSFNAWRQGNGKQTG